MHENTDIMVLTPIAVEDVNFKNRPDLCYWVTYPNFRRTLHYARLTVPALYNSVDLKGLDKNYWVDISAMFKQITEDLLENHKGAAGVTIAEVCSLAADVENDVPPEIDALRLQRYIQGFDAGRYTVTHGLTLFSYRADVRPFPTWPKYTITLADGQSILGTVGDCILPETIMRFPNTEELEYCIDVIVANFAKKGVEIKDIALTTQGAKAQRVF